MEERRCEACGRKLSPRLRKDARFCDRTCKSNGHRWRKQSPAPPLGPNESLGRIPAEFIPFANTLFYWAPPGTTDYILRKIGCPHGNGVFRFPVPNRVTKHSDNTLRESHFYRLYPFEAPRVPWEGYYDVLFLVSSQGLVAPEDPSQQQVYVKSVVPRAAWDEQALWEFIPAAEGSLDGSSADLANQIALRAPNGALGYLLATSRSPHGDGSFLFPVPERMTRRLDGSLSDRPYYRLNPYETPMVPWPGYYSLSFLLPQGFYFIDPVPERRILYVGHVYPHADYDRTRYTPTITITENDRAPQLPGRGPLGLLNGRGTPRKPQRRRSAR